MDNLPNGAGPLAPLPTMEDLGVDMGIGSKVGTAQIRAKSGQDWNGTDRSNVVDIELTLAGFRAQLMEPNCVANLAAVSGSWRHAAERANPMTAFRAVEATDHNIVRPPPPPPIRT